MHSILKANIPGSSCISAAAVAAAAAVTIVIVVACYCCSGLLFISVLNFSRGAPYMHRKTQIDENIHWLTSPDSCFGAILHVCGILVCTWYYQFDGHSMYKTRLKSGWKRCFFFHSLKPAQHGRNHSVRQFQATRSAFEWIFFKPSTVCACEFFLKYFNEKSKFGRRQIVSKKNRNIFKDVVPWFIVDFLFLPLLLNWIHNQKCYS